MLRERSNTVRFQLPGVSNESKADQAQVEAAINRARRTSVAPPKPMTGCGNRKTSGIGGPRMAPAHAPAGVKRGSLFRLGSSKGRGSLAFANQIAAGAPVVSQQQPAPEAIASVRKASIQLGGLAFHPALTAMADEEESVRCSASERTSAKEEPALQNKAFFRRRSIIDRALLGEQTAVSRNPKRFGWDIFVIHPSNRLKNAFDLFIQVCRAFELFFIYCRLVPCASHHSLAPLLRSSRSTPSPRRPYASPLAPKATTYGNGRSHYYSSLMLYYTSSTDMSRGAIRYSGAHSTVFTDAAAAAAAENTDICAPFSRVCSACAKSPIVTSPRGLRSRRSRLSHSHNLQRTATHYNCSA